MCTCPAGTHPLTVQDREVQGRTGQVCGNIDERKGSKEWRKSVEGVRQGQHFVTIVGWLYHGIRYCTLYINNQSKAINQNTMQYSETY